MRYLIIALVAYWIGVITGGTRPEHTLAPPIVVLAGLAFALSVIAVGWIVYNGLLAVL